VDVFNKRGNKLNEEEVKEAIRFLEEEKNNGEKTLARFYSHIFKKAIAKIKQEKLISDEDINGLVDRFDTLDKFEREFDIDIPNTMLLHYTDPKKYRFGLKNLFLISLVRAFKGWSREKGIVTDNIEENVSMLKKEANEDIYVSTLIEILLTLGSYYDYVQYESKRERFINNTEEFIDKILSDIPIDMKLIKPQIKKITKEVYEGLKKKGYISKELPSFDILEEAVPTFSKHFIELISTFRDSNYTIGRLALASLCGAIMDQVGIFNNSGYKVSDKVSELNKEIEKLMQNNEITEDDVNTIKRFQDELFEMRKQSLKEVIRGDGKRGGVLYI